jgi:hypothetical protein
MPMKSEGRASRRGVIFSTTSSSSASPVIESAVDRVIWREERRGWAGTDFEVGAIRVASVAPGRGRAQPHGRRTEACASAFTAGAGSAHTRRCRSHAADQPCERGAVATPVRHGRAWTPPIAEEKVGRGCRHRDRVRRGLPCHGHDVEHQSWADGGPIGGWGSRATLDAPTDQRGSASRPGSQGAVPRQSGHRRRSCGQPAGRVCGCPAGGNRRRESVARVAALAGACGGITCSGSVTPPATSAPRRTASPAPRPSPQPSGSFDSSGEPSDSP